MGSFGGNFGANFDVQVLVPVILPPPVLPQPRNLVRLVPKEIFEFRIIGRIRIRPQTLYPTRKLSIRSKKKSKSLESWYQLLKLLDVIDDTDNI